MSPMTHSRAAVSTRSRRGNTPAPSPSMHVAPQHDRVLQLQRDAGNGAVCQLLVATPTDRPTATALAVQRATTTSKPKAPKPPRNDVDAYLDLVNGLNELLVAATHKGWQGLYAPKLGKSLSTEHRALLERVRRVLIKAQGTRTARREAQAEWPKLAAKLRIGIGDAKKLGLSAKGLAATLDNLDAVTEHYVNAANNKSGDQVKGGSYAAFAEGVRRMVNVVDTDSYDRTSAVIPLNIEAVNEKQRAALQAITFGDGLDAGHLALLEQLRKTFLLARTVGSAKRAVSEWKKIGPDVLALFDKAGKYIDVDASQTRSTLVDISQKLIYGGAYAEAHNAARDKIDLKSPTLAFEKEKVKAAAADLMVAKDIADKAVNITASASMDAIFKKAKIDAELGGAIWDIAHNPSDVVAKLADFNKRSTAGKLVTVADMGEKMLALRNAVYGVSLTAVKEFAASQAKTAAAKGLAEAAAKWEKVGSWASGKLDVLAKVGKVAGAIAIAVSVVKMFDAIAQGDWGAALQEAGQTALGLGATAAGGMAGAAMFAGIGVIIAAQAEGIAGAAAMIRYCKQANVREAALDFIGICEDAANIEAKSLIADAKILGDPDLADQREFILQKLDSHKVWWVRHVGRMQALVVKDRVNAIGGQPALRQALGFPAIGALFGPVPTTWEGLGKQIATVFEGANSMSDYVVKNYPRAGAA